MCFAANAAEEDFLIYWQVQDPVVDVYGNGLGGEKTGETSIGEMVEKSGVSLDYWVARVGVYDTTSGSLVDYVMIPDAGASFTMLNGEPPKAAGPTYADISGYVTLTEGGNRGVAADWTSGEYVFALELGYLDVISETEFNFNQMAQSDKWSYTDFITSASEGHNYIKSTQLQLPDTEAWTGVHFSQTPEPTSGMLVLFGLSFLALRRKQQEKGAA